MFYRIDINFVIKVADFGLSESLDMTKNYFRQGQEDVIKLPIKWQPPESVNDGIFSEKSDVVSYTPPHPPASKSLLHLQWSYGILCWEIFSGGKTPYPGVHPVDVPRQLDTGYRLEKPVNAACSDEM